MENVIEGKKTITDLTDFYMKKIKLAVQESTNARRKFWRNLVRFFDVGFFMSKWYCQKMGRVWKPQPTATNRNEPQPAWLKFSYPV